MTCRPGMQLHPETARNPWCVPARSRPSHGHVTSRMSWPPLRPPDEARLEDPAGTVRLARHGALHDLVWRIEEIARVEAAGHRREQGETQGEVEHVSWPLDHVREGRIAGRIDALADAIEEERRARRTSLRRVRDAAVEDERRLSDHGSVGIGRARRRLAEVDPAPHQGEVGEHREWGKTLGDGAEALSQLELD